MTRLLPADLLEALEQFCDTHYWPHEHTPVPQDQFLSFASRSEGLLTMLTDTVDEHLLRSSPRLRVVANMAVGYDNIDVDACTAHGVMVCNTPGVSEEAVADLAFGLLLACARRIPEADRVLRAGGWKAWSPGFMVGVDVHAKTLGIMGFGRIGLAVARRAQGFDMNVLYWDKVRRHEAERRVGAKHVSLDELCRTSDFVMVVLPLNAHTRGLIGRREIAMMKRTCVLLNVGRGAVVNRHALYEALLTKKLRAAGLDVYDSEPVDISEPLTGLDNTVLLPHIGSATLESRRKMAEKAVANLLAAVTGSIPDDLVNKEVVSHVARHTDVILPSLVDEPTRDLERRVR